MIHRFAGLLIFAVCLIGLPVQAADDQMTFAQPIACELGADCWIPNYVDLKPGKGVLDYTCGDATYDAPPRDQHKGTDFAVRDMAAVRTGVPVMAAAAGVVVGTRDGLVDISADEANKGTLTNQECGNGVRIRHDQGYFTQYCHMRQNSVLPKTGERVKRGQQLGLVGLSGQTVFPHLHFQVERGKEVIDPFAGPDRQKACGIGAQTLWDEAALAKLPYQPTAIYNAGFAPQKPDLKAIRDGQYNGQYQDRPFDAKAPAMVVWAELFRVRAGDRIVLAITDPEGSPIHNQRIVMKDNKARYYIYSGLRLKQPQWQPGTYRGEISLIRKSDVISTTRQVDVR